MSAQSIDSESVSGFKLDFPPAFGYDQLSVLLGRTVASLQRDRCRKPNTLPPACTPPGTKAPRWLLSDVLAWLAEHREAPRHRRALAKRDGPGRPDKAAEIATRKARAEAAA